MTDAAEDKALRLGASPRLAATALLLALPSVAVGQEASLTGECARVYQVYPRLMLAAMMESDANCGDPDSGEFFSCYEGESAAAKTARERRLAIRKHQAEGYRVADAACRAWEADNGNAHLAEALRGALAQARATDRWRPESAAAQQD